MFVPTERPHRWQNLAPGERVALQPAQVVVSSDAPQFAQKRPVPGVAQAGQVITEEEEGSVMRYNLLAATIARTAPARGTNDRLNMKAILGATLSADDGTKLHFMHKLFFSRQIIGLKAGLLAPFLAETT